MGVPVINLAQMREWEKATWGSGQTEGEVIRRVGMCVATQARALTQPNDLVLILAGKGNNGADARSAKDHLLDRAVAVLEVKEPETDLEALQAQLSLRPALVIDGLFGIGLNRPLGTEWQQFIQRVNDAQTRVLAVDVPSGLN